VKYASAHPPPRTARWNAVALALVADHADCDQHRAAHVAQQDFSAGTHVVHRVIQQQRHADHECGDADLVQPAFAEDALEIGKLALGRLRRDVRANARQSCCCRRRLYARGVRLRRGGLRL
jgi:hypothetical protein